MKTNFSQVKADFFVNQNIPQMAESRERQPNENSAGVKTSGGFYFGRSVFSPIEKSG